MGRKNRSHNNNVKRERFAVKELARLKKCLGLVVDGKELLESAAEISTITDVKAIKKKQKEAELQKALDTEMDSDNDDDKKAKDLVVKNEKSGVTHVYDAKTKRDQFGNYPIWHNRNSENKKKRLKSRANPKRSKKRMSLFNVSNPKDYK